MKLVKFLVVFVFLTFIALPAFSEEYKMTAYVGDNFKIEVASNATTGYQWQISEPLDKNIIELVSSEYISPKTNLTGAGGKEIWVFRAVKKGKTKISLSYARPWESVPPAIHNIYMIDVKEKR